MKPKDGFLIKDVCRYRVSNDVVRWLKPDLSHARTIGRELVKGVPGFELSPHAIFQVNASPRFGFNCINGGGVCWCNKAGDVVDLPIALRFYGIRP